MVVTTFVDQRPLQGSAALLDWRMNGRLSQIFIRHRYRGETNESLLLPSEGRIKAKEVLILGLGLREAFNESHVAPFTQYLIDKLSQKRVSDFMISFSDFIRERFEWRNSVRLLISRLNDYPQIESVRLCESDDCVRDAMRRHMDFGINVDVSFETLNS